MTAPSTGFMVSNASAPPERTEAAPRASARRAWRHAASTRRVVPGFGLTLGYTMLYLSLIVLIPLSATFIRSLGGGWEHFWNVVTAPRVMASLRLSFGAALL